MSSKMTFHFSSEKQKKGNEENKVLANATRYKKVAHTLFLESYPVSYIVEKKDATDGGALDAIHD